MVQITLELDEETLARVHGAADAAGVSVSEWIGAAVRARVGTAWPREVVEMAGAWSDLPAVEEVMDVQVEDVARDGDLPPIDRPPGR